MKFPKINKEIIFFSVIGLLILFIVVDTYFDEKAAENSKNKIFNLKQESEIEKVTNHFKKTNLQAEKQADLESQAKKRKELAIWKSRCLKSNIENIIAEKEERENCSSDLERFASYNLNL